MDRLAEVWLKSERAFGRLPHLFPQGDRWLKSQCAVTDCIRVGEQRPGKRELRVQSHRLLKVFLCAKGVACCVQRLQAICQTAQVGIVGLWVVSRSGGDDLLFLAGEFRS